MKIFITYFFLIFSFISLSAKEQKTIGIFTYKVYTALPWDPDSIKTGLTGSEEAVVYMSQKLADLGYRVIILGNPPLNSSYSLPDSNPKYVDLNDENEGMFDIGISWRLSDRAKELKGRCKKVYLWPHDSSFYKLSDEQIDAFDDVLWLSEWQWSQWCSVNPGFTKFTNILGNGINPEQFGNVEERENPYSCIYGSNYGQGLELLLDFWPMIKQMFPRATLDIYYGWKHWGYLTTEQEMKMREQIDNLAPLDVQEHGLVSHEEITNAYKKASFWTYPCFWTEAFCITALRAQFAGAIPVVIDGSALKETVRFGYKCYSEEQYIPLLVEAMQNASQISEDQRKNMRQFILDEFTWRKVAQKWKDVFESKD